ncbi:MAG: thiol:disulfide interchange protein, partial [Candidatus Neomarinimicrobiota bacterium]
MIKTGLKTKLPIILTFFILFALTSFGKSTNSILKIETYLSTNGVYKGQDFNAAIVVKLKEPWHINSSKPLDEFVVPTEIRFEESEYITITNIHFPPHEIKNLSFSDEPLAVYQGDIIITVSGKILERAQEKVILKGHLLYQGCNDQVCIAPKDTPFSLSIPILKSTDPIVFQNSEYFATEELFDNNSQSSTFDVKASFAREGIFLTFILIFLGGLGLNLTPCVYPLIPITVSYFGGQVSGKQGKKIIMAILYVLGIAVINSTIGTLAALSGELLGTFMTNPFVLVFIAAILITLSLSMFGVYEFRLPSFMMNLGGGSRTGYFGSLVMGLTMGIVAAPCIGPLIIGLLTYVASIGNPFLGFAMFFTLSLGLGVPFIFLAFFSSKINSLPRSGEWMVGVRIIFGLILVGMALYFINPLIPKSIYGILFPLYIIGSGIYLLLLSKSGKNAPAFIFIKQIIAIAAIILGTWFLKPEGKALSSMNWKPFTEKSYITALETEKPIILDFYADWCIPCKEMDKFTFSNSEVVKLSNQFSLFKINLTSGISPETF